MAYAVVFYFDENSEIPILNVWNELEQASLCSPLQKGPIRPHITLAIYDSINCSECESEIKNLSERSGILTIQGDHFGIFPNQKSVIFIAPPPSNELMEFHKKIHQMLEGNISGDWEMYKPGDWVPHCTLAQDIHQNKLSTALEICMKINLPIELRIIRVGVVEFEPVTPLFDIKLSQN